MDFWNTISRSSTFVASAGDHLCAEFLAELAHLAHADGYGSVAQGDDGTLLYGLLGHFPGDALVIQGAEDDAALSFQKVVTHYIFFSIRLQSYAFSAVHPNMRLYLPALCGVVRLLFGLMPLFFRQIRIWRRCIRRGYSCIAAKG